VALLFFLGQEGFHEYGSDYVAISYVKGHVLFTWDLGAGLKK
jgi:EYS protein